ncbi:MAG: system component, Glc family [Anaerocolumna sp.]|jgi:PTS system beta-glucosides-specific IIC component|nr:system component, Glc family [Anaerocolumna sp.]
MFSRFGDMLRSKDRNKVTMYSPMEGELCSINDVSDPTFSKKILGEGIAIIPHVGRVISPVDGVIYTIFETNHALTILSDTGCEILIHIGIDTVELKGKFFNAFVKTDDKVKKGDLLLEFDVERIRESGYEVISPIVICNTNDYDHIQMNNSNYIKENEILMTMKMKK